MCKFLSLISQPSVGNKIYYFDLEIRKELNHDNPNDYEFDSHTSICSYFKLDEDSCNKFEYNPFTKEFVIDQINNKIDDRVFVKKFIKSLDLKDLIVVSDKSWLHGSYRNGEINISLPYIAVTEPEFFEQGEIADEYIDEIYNIWIKSNLTQEQAFNKWVNSYLHFKRR